MPALMAMGFAKGLVLPSMDRTGQAFLSVDMEVKRLIQLGDTLSVHCAVIEARATSKPGPGLVRTPNTVTSQNGETVLVYKPLRLVRARDDAQAPKIDL